MAEPGRSWITTFVLLLELGLDYCRIVEVLKCRRAANLIIIKSNFITFYSRFFIFFGIEAFTFPTVHEPRARPLSRIRDWARPIMSGILYFWVLIQFEVRFRNAYGLAMRCARDIEIELGTCCALVCGAPWGSIWPPFVSVTLTQERSGALRVLFWN